MSLDSEECRLCLDPFAHNVQSIENPELKDQMEKVFHFQISFIAGYPNSVCQSCTYTISEFYQFSEKVRRNQQQLSGESCREDCIESKVTIEETAVEEFEQCESTDSVTRSSEVHVPQDELKDATTFINQAKPLMFEPEKALPFETFSNHDEQLNQGQLSDAETCREKCRQTAVMIEADVESRSSDCVEFDADICTPQEMPTVPVTLVDQEKILICEDQHSSLSSETLTKREKRRNLEQLRLDKTKKRKVIQSAVPLNTVESESSDCVELDAEGCPSRDTTSPISFVKHEKPLILEAFTDYGKHPASEIFTNLDEQSFMDSPTKQDELGAESCDSGERYEPYFNRITKRKNKKHEPDEFSPRNKTLEETLKENKKIQDFYQMVCDLCGLQTATFNQLLNHFRTAHERAGYALCCRKKLYSARFLLEHMALHANPSAFKCEMCGRKFSSKAYLSAHHKKVHEWNRPFSCDRCSKTFAAEYLLKSHMISHDKIPCPMCDKQLASPGALQNHLAALHNDKHKTMTCGSCGIDFVRRIDLDRHMKSHVEAKGGEKTQCNVCSCWLPSEPELMQHMIVTHKMTVVKCHVCPICRRNFQSSNKLADHRRVVHGTKRFKCNFCGLIFDQAKNFKEHLTTHVGENMHACEICGTKSKTKKNLTRHIKRQHPVEWAQRKLNVTHDEEIIVIS